MKTSENIWSRSGDHNINIDELSQSEGSLIDHVTIIQE